MCRSLGDRHQPLEVLQAPRFSQRPVGGLYGTYLATHGRMQLHRFETPGLAHYAYLIADEGVGAIVDPSRYVDDYIETARSLGVRIDYVIETHRQEDFVMGSAHLAELTGAKVVNGRHACFGRGHLRLADGHTFDIGGLTIRALHTPGHTPESMSYAVFASEAPKRAWGVFTGDTLFFGDTGRTDLPAAEKSVDNAALLYDSVNTKLAPLGDATLIFPAHGPGSVCGSGMAPRPMSTIGAEKLYNPVFILDREAFAAEKGGERIPRPPYFRHMEDVNLLGGLPPVAHVPRLLSAEELSDRPGDSILIDTREPEAYAGGHIGGAYSVWLGGLPLFGGWVAAHDSEVYLYADSVSDVEVAIRYLGQIGIDGVRGILRGGFGTWRSSGRPIERAGVITPRELAERLDDFTVVDVREDDEVARGRIPGARHIYVGYLEEALPALELDRAKPIAVTCGVGHRAGVAASILRRAGYEHVYNLLGGMTAWQRLRLRTEAEPA